MRVPIFVPLLLVVAAVVLLGVDVAGVVGAAEPSHSHTRRHADDQQTFVASIQYPVDRGDEIRTSGYPVRSTVVHGPDGSRQVADPVLALRDHLRFLVIPVWELDDLAANGTATVLHESDDALGPQTYRVGDLPPPPPAEGGQVRVLEPSDFETANGSSRLRLADHNGSVPGWHASSRAAGSGGTIEGEWRVLPSVALVWLLQNDTADYAELSRLLLDGGVEGSGADEPPIVAVDGAVVARDPWLRGSAAALSAAALVLAVLPRVRMLPRALPNGPAGAGIELAAVGRCFLVSLRDAYVALAAAVLLLGVPLILSLSLFADNAAAGDALFGEPREQPSVGWHGALWGLLLLTLAAGVAAAARPAVEAHLALRRWRRREQAPPVEGDLAD